MSIDFFNKKNVVETSPMIINRMIIDMFRLAIDIEKIKINTWN